MVAIEYYYRAPLAAFPLLRDVTVTILEIREVKIVNGSNVTCPFVFE